MTQTKIQVRVDAEKVALWKEAAYRRRQTLSEWMRETLTIVASRQTEKTDV